jgi:hypothetical protein
MWGKNRLKNHPTEPWASRLTGFVERKTHQGEDRTPTTWYSIYVLSRWLVPAVRIMHMQKGGETAQITGRAARPGPSRCAEVGPHQGSTVAREMRAAVGTGFRNLCLRFHQIRQPYEMPRTLPWFNGQTRPGASTNTGGYSGNLLFTPYWVTRFSVHMQRVAGDAIARSLVAPTADEGKPGLPSSVVFSSYLSYTDVMGAGTV